MHRLFSTKSERNSECGMHEQTNRVEIVNDTLYCSTFSLITERLNFRLKTERCLIDWLIQPRTDPSKLLRAATAVFRSAFHLGGWARTSPCRPRYLRSAGPARQRWTASRQRFDSRAWIGHELRILSDCKLQIIRKSFFGPDNKLGQGTKWW